MKLKHIGTTALFAFALTACSQDPVEVVYRGSEFYGQSNIGIQGTHRQDTLIPIEKPRVQALEVIRVPTNYASKDAVYEGKTHRVREGDTLYSIAKRYGIDVPTLMHRNGIENPRDLKVGKTLRLSDHVAIASRKTFSPIKEPAYIPDPTETIASDFPGHLDWPIRGRILSTFGSKGKGLRNDGINIEARNGTSIHAAEDGVVVYAGDKLKGYGNLVILRHKGGWMTAYAHTRDIRVERGETVRKGDVIGHVGQTGGVDRPQLHFGVRKGTTAVNPLPLLTS